MSTVVIMAEKQTPYIIYLLKSYDSRTSINHVLYNTEIPNLTFVIKCLLHDYVIDATCVVSVSYTYIYIYIRTAEHIMSLAHSSISACSSYRDNTCYRRTNDFLCTKAREHIFNFLNVFHKPRTTV